MIESLTPVRMTRENLPPGDNLCAYCTAKCCHYIALPIDTPTEKNDFENLRWYILHGKMSVFVDDGTWYLCVYAVCNHLLPDYRCGIYHTRPQICRDYSFQSCEYDEDGTHDLFFETPDQLAEYAEAFFNLDLDPEVRKSYLALPMV